MELAAKPVPVTFNVFPTIPLLEDKEIDEFIVNGLLAESADASVAVTV